MSKAICITGMHRSGTSLTASWLQQCGVVIDKGRLMGPSEGNPKGHFEDEDFVDFQSSIIKNEINNSKGWVVSNRTFNFNEKEIEFANNIIFHRNVNYDLWGWKDPRSVLFLDEWKKVLPNLKFVLVWREAHEVVESLQKRYNKSSNKLDEIGILEGYKVWCHYNYSILKFYKLFEKDCVLFNINKLMEQDELVYNAIKSKLELSLDYQPINQLIEPKLFTQTQKKISDKIIGAYFNLNFLEQKLLAVSL